MTFSPPVLPHPHLGVFKAALLTLALCLGLAAQSVHAADDDSRGPQRMQRMEGLRKQLALSEAQAAQWKSAFEASEKLRREMREARRARMDQVKAELDQAAPDLRAIAARMDREREAQALKHKQAREAWLKFYDGLDQAQKEKASRFLLQQITRLEDFASHHDRMFKNGPRAERD